MAGCCETYTTILRDCESNIGGVRRIFANCHDRVIKPTVNDSHMIATIVTPEAPEDWKEFEFNQETVSATTTLTKDQQTGSLYYETLLVAVFPKQDTPKRLNLIALEVSDNDIIYEDNNGHYWYMGFDNAIDNSVTVSEGDSVTGTAFGDLNGYNVTFRWVSKTRPYELSDAAIDQLLGVTPDPEP